MTLNSHPWSTGSITRRSQIFYLLLPRNWRVDGGGGSRGFEQVTSADSCRMKEIEGVGTVELMYIGRLLRMGCDSLLMPLCGSVGGGFTGKEESNVWVVRAGTWWPGNLHGSRMAYHGNILLKTNGGKRGRDRKPNLLGGEDRQRQKA